MDKKEFEDLIRIFESHYKYYKGWVFEYEHPGVFTYHQMGGPLSVYFTPEYDEPGVIPVQVTSVQGENIEVKSIKYIHPENTEQELHADQLFRIVRPFLEKFDTW
jgi:hypothetical protein